MSEATPKNSFLVEYYGELISGAEAARQEEELDDESVFPYFLPKRSFRLHQTRVTSSNIWQFSFSQNSSFSLMTKVFFDIFHLQEEIYVVTDLFCDFNNSSVCSCWIDLSTRLYSLQLPANNSRLVLT